MDKIWQKLSGLVFATVMTFALANRTYAENDETILPDTPPAAIAEATADVTDPAQEAVAPAGEEQEVPEEEAEAALDSAEEAQAEEESSPAGQEPLMARGLTAPALFTEEAPEEESILLEGDDSLEAEETAVEETILEAEAESTDPEEGPHPLELVLTEENEVLEVVSEQEVIIKTAGLRHISSLTSDGDVYIIGTGILLVDEVDLLVGCNLYLESFEEIYGKNGGTVALFVFTEEKDDVRSYELINGMYADGEGEHVIPAVLDEEYELPAGIRLVIPDGGAIVMQCVNTLVEKIADENGETETIVTHSTTGSPELHYPLDTEGYIPEKISSAPVLTVSEGSSLEIRSGASVLLNHLARYGVEQFINSPLIKILGTLAMEGDIEGGAVFIGGSGDVTGSGVFTGSDKVTVETRSSPVTELNVKDATLYIDGGVSIDSMTVSGDTEMRFYGDWTVNSLEVNDGSLKTYNYQLGDADTITIAGTVSGNGTVDLSAGNILLAGGSESCSAVIDAGSHLSYVYSSGEGILRYNEETGSLQKAPLIPQVGAVSQSGGNSCIPVAEAEIVDSALARGFGTMTYYEKLTVPVDEEDRPVVFVSASDTELTYQLIDSVLGEGAEQYDYLVETYAGGVYGYAMLKSTSTETVTASDVIQIVRGTMLKNQAPDGGNTVTNTDTTYTGSGVLGGGGAGSVTGGTRRLAVTGTREATGDPEPGSDLRVWTENRPEEGCFELMIEIGGKPFNRLAAPVKVQMAYTPASGLENGSLYVVFRDRDGSLKAFEAVYDPVTGMLSFSADIAGRFVVVAFDFDGEPFTAAFYEALSELEEVKAALA